MKFNVFKRIKAFELLTSFNIIFLLLFHIYLINESEEKFLKQWF